MKRYIFPIVIYYNEDDNNYIVAFEDLEMFTEGDSIESAFESAKSYLEVYLSTQLKMNFDIEEASKYLDVKKNHEQEIVLLVDTELKSLDYKKI